jgi:hypothetical protein
VQKTNSDNSAAWPAGWDSHRNNEIVYTALNTTPAQRFRWLEEMLDLLRPQMMELMKARESAPDRQYKKC